MANADVGGLAEDTTTEAVSWPQDAIDAEGQDLAQPVATLLRRLALLETKDAAGKDLGPFSGTPYSLQVITAGATSGAKVAGIAASSASFTGALGAAWAAYNASDLPLRIALIAAVGVILAAGVIAVAIIVQSDVRARADATDAMYQARATITSEFLRQAGSKVAPPAGLDRSVALLHALAAFPGRVKVTWPGGDNQRVTGVGHRHEGLQVRLADGDWIKLDDVESFETETPSSR